MGVLTRSGWLHLFASTDDSEPSESLCLRACAARGESAARARAQSAEPRVLTIGDKKMVILRNHGLLTVGQSVDAAAYWFITAERSCQTQLMAMAAGSPVLIDHESAALAHRQTGSELAGAFSFHPLWTWITTVEPDLLD